MKMVADRSYIVRIGKRDVKRHIDGLIRDNSGKRNSCIANDAWVYGNNNAESRESAVPIITRRYSNRVRRPVERYGVSN